MQSEHLPGVLRSIADDLCVAGPQYAGIVSVMRQAAKELEECRNAAVPAATPSGGASSPVIDGDSAPVLGRPCPGCEE